MKTFKKVLAGFLALALAVTAIGSDSTLLQVKAEPREVTLTNLALNKPVTVSYQDTKNNFVGSNAVDGNLNTRWATEPYGTDQSLTVDLGAESLISAFRIAAENVEAQKIGQFLIEGSNDNSTYSTIYQSEDRSASGGFDLDSSLSLEQSVRYRYVKITIQKLITGAWNSISLREFEVLGVAGQTEGGDGGGSTTQQDPTVNVALHKTAVASSEEAHSVRAANAVDGNTTGGDSRWGSAIGSGPHWIYIDLGKVMNVQTIRVFWETRKATSYKIQLAQNLSSSMEESDWTDAKVFNSHPGKLNEEIILQYAQQARYVRLYVDSFSEKDPDSEESYNTISIYEMEVYGGILPRTVTLDSLLEQIEVVDPSASDETLTVDLPVEEGFTVTYNGTDFEQVVGNDLKIYKPVVDKTVKVSFKAVQNETGAYKFREIPVTIPGQYSAVEGDNAAPDILPELQEWKGTEGVFTAGESAKAVYAEDALKETMEAFAKDYEIITGKKLTVAKGTADNASAGDFYFALTTDTDKGLQEEGYLLDVSGKVTVEAETATGAYWATRTILQSIRQTGNIPCGVARDYPLYKVRGFILDVGRKTFTLDFLKQVVQQMAWYKMNDFQVHLNDNLIFLGSVPDPMQAYSGFRLESDIKAGQQDGDNVNAADLTSKDVFYTKDEFRSLIKESRTYGVNIVPEIDTPAHSLALTKVKPWLRHGTSGTATDHLNLIGKYNESLQYVQDIFSEYMTGDNPVFDGATILHVGADEYNADGDAYRNFANDMLSFVDQTGRTARIWGSLTTIKGSGRIDVRGDVDKNNNSYHNTVQMNLWNAGWANIKEMYDLGFDLINCNDGNYYIVPNAGYYHPEGISDGEYYNGPINTISGITIPAGDRQMIGGAFAVWNDMTDYCENGVSEYDAYVRFDNGFSMFGANLWGKGSKDLSEAQEAAAKSGEAPQTNFAYDVASKDDAIAHYRLDDMKDVSGNGYDLTAGKNASIVEVDSRKALELKGGESYVSTELTTAGLNNSLRVKVKRTSDSTDEQILFESSYGTIKAVQKDTGKVGFTRENRDYSFNYELPLNEWVELEIVSTQYDSDMRGKTSLYVNGNLVDVIGDDEKVDGRSLIATTMIPFARIGSTENAFIGYVDDVRLGTGEPFASSMKLDHAVWTAKELLKTVENAELAALVEQAEAVINTYAPSETDIQELAAAINEKIDAVSYEKADYTRVEEYLALVPANTGVFTEESVAALETVIASIIEELPATMQERVDGYEAALASALAGLELKTAQNVNYVDNESLTATASSYQSGAEPAKAIDGDPTTMWHSDWNITGNGIHWIDLKLNEATEINGLTYVPRSQGNNGMPTEYTIKVSSDGGANYRDITTGTLPVNAEDKVISFDTTEVTNVRLCFDEAVNGNGSAAEIKLHLANVSADITGLNAVIAKAKALVKGNYTDASWSALQAIIAEAEGLAAASAPDADIVETMKRTLSKKMTALQLNAVELASEEQKQQLDNFTKTAIADESKYTEESVAAYKELQKEVEKALEGRLTAQKAIELLAKINGCRLKEKSPGKPNNSNPPKDTQNPSSGNGSSTVMTPVSGGNAKTGDSSDVILFVLLAWAAFVGMISFGRKFRREIK